ncbi:hypothetical protein OBBRIDRAFT_742694, partial [Obba rivulosa]
PEVSDSKPVCIIGAGAAGLYAAMMLHYLQVPFKVLEAAETSPSRRLGGRLYTQHVGDGTWDYFDVGAMHFPNTPFMKRTFSLADELDVKRIPYAMKAPNTFTHYNGRQVQGESALSGDPYGVARYVDPNNRIPNAPLTPEAVHRSCTSPTLDLFTGDNFDLDLAFQQLYGSFDKYTMRTWLQDRTAAAINWCEMIDRSTGWYDRALVETVLEYLAFSWPRESTPSFDGKWYCFVGGSSSLPEAMYKSLPPSSVAFGRTVTAINEVRTSSSSHMEVTVNSANTPTAYSAVISTVPLPRISVMDLTGCDIVGSSYAQWSAIRQLHYGPAIKIGMRFTEAWWYTKLNIQGDSSFTDLPLRTIVYPLYPSLTAPSSVLIAAYCWTYDAERLGALMNGDGTARDELIDLVLRDLSTVHGIDVKKYYDRSSRDNAHFAWNWSADPHAMGMISDALRRGSG